MTCVGSDDLSGAWESIWQAELASATTNRTEGNARLSGARLVGGIRAGGRLGGLDPDEGGGAAFQADFVAAGDLGGDGAGDAVDVDDAELDAGADLVALEVVEEIEVGFGLFGDAAEDDGLALFDLVEVDSVVVHLKAAFGRRDGVAVGAGLGPAEGFVEALEEHGGETGL